MRSEGHTGERGFTLIELLLVIAVIGILASVAITQYALYKQKATDAAMQSTLHAARQAMEALYAGSVPESYVTATVTALQNFGFPPGPDNVTLQIVSKTSDAYVLRVCAIGGTAPSMVYDTAVGAMVYDTGACS